MKDTAPYIFLDTCSLLDSCWNRRKESDKGDVYEYSKDKETQFWKVEFANLENMGTVIIPARNYEELQKHASSKKNEGLAQRAKSILGRINVLVAKKRIEIVGDKNDPFADAILLSAALKFRTQKNMAFITQDRKLAEDLEAIRRFRSVRPRKGFDIKIRRISKTGSLEEHRGLCVSTAKKRGENKQRTDGAVDPNLTSGWWDA